MMRFLMVEKSGNAKTGPMPASISPRETCPPSCRLLGKGCYAECAPLVWHWNRLSKGNTGLHWQNFLYRVAALECKTWRHNQAGDLPGEDGRLDYKKCMELTEVNCVGGRNRGGFTYTHYPVLSEGCSTHAVPGVSGELAFHNARVVREMNDGGFTVNLSADNVDHADALTRLNAGPVVVILPRGSRKRGRTKEGSTVEVCRALSKETTCLECGWCKSRRRRVVVGFPAHGGRAAIANEIASQGEMPWLEGGSDV